MMPWVLPVPPPALRRVFRAGKPRAFGEVGDAERFRTSLLLRDM